MDTLKKLLEEAKQVYKNPSEVSDEQAFGIVIANYFKWDIISGLETSKHILTECNEHKGAALIEKHMNDEYSE